jgi:hypothetical protein
MIEEEIEKVKKEVEKSVEERIELLEGEKARLFAISGELGKVWDTAASWWAVATESYTKVGQNELVRVSVDKIIENLEKCERLADDYKNKIEECVSSIPEILAREKKQIQAKLAELSKGRKT